MPVGSFRAQGASRFFPISALCGAAVVMATSTAQAIPVTAVQFTDGMVLNVQAVVGTGSNSAYEAIDFDDGTAEAWQYNFNGSLNGYQMLQGIEAATTLKDDSTYYGAPYDEHLYTDLYDGSHITDEYPDLYYSPPANGDTPVSGTQGITYAYSGLGLDDLNISNGEIIGWDTYGSGAPVLPETAVPEPTMLLGGALVIGGLLQRRRVGGAGGK